MIISEKSISNYAFDQANLLFTLDNNDSFLDKISSFKINARPFQSLAFS